VFILEVHLQLLLDEHGFLPFELSLAKANVLEMLSNLIGGLGGFCCYVLAPRGHWDS